jgi:hypothetical protein
MRKQQEIIAGLTEKIEDLELIEMRETVKNKKA